MIRALCMIAQPRATSRPVSAASGNAVDTAPDDITLLGRIRADDASAFTVLFGKYYDSLRSFASRRIGSSAVGEEVVQDVFLTLWRGRHSLTVQTSPATYLRVAVRNAAASYLRREQLRARYDAEFAVASRTYDPGIDVTLAQAETGAVLRAAIARLPERCRLAFEYHQLREMTYKEIASTLGISPKTVDAQIVRAVKLLRAQLCTMSEQPRKPKRPQLHPRQPRNASEML